MAQQAEKLLQRPLYGRSGHLSTEGGHSGPLTIHAVFDLPEELLSTLQLKSQPTTAADAITSPSPNGSDAQDAAPTTATSCGLCGLTFSSLQEQRDHVRSDLHGYNLKQKMRGSKPVSEIDFERLIGELDESISGSDSSDTEDDSDDELGASKHKDSTLSALLKRQANLVDGDAEDAPTKKRKRGSGKPPLIWFATSKFPSNTSLGIYRAIFSNADQDQENRLVDILKKRQLAPKPAPSQKSQTSQDDEGGVPLPASMVSKGTSASDPHYFLCMIGGGHFAAMIVSLTPKLIRRSGVEDRSATVIAHKTFHRYTTRRKQGGSQSANDNSKGNAHSAGSSLRRYNETALVEEVRALLAEWRSLIDTADLLFIRATGSTNRRTLFGPYEGQVMNHRDIRIRGFPFNTRRATQSELMRAFVELTRVKVSTIDEAALAKQAEEAAAAAAIAAAAKSDSASNLTPSKPPKPSKEDEEAALHTTQLQALIRRSKAPAMLQYLQTHHLPPGFLFSPPASHHQAPTPLHLAAASGSPVCVTTLLLKANADPTVQNADGKTAFDISADRPTRDAFRLARGTLGEDRWAWDAAGVPAALSQAEADARTARDKAEQAADLAAEQERRRTEMDRLRREDAANIAANRDRKFGKGQALSAAPPLTAEERRREEARGMTDEMRLRLEREKRARAAEERIRRLQGR